MRTGASLVTDKKGPEIRYSFLNINCRKDLSLLQPK